MNIENGYLIDIDILENSGVDNSFVMRLVPNAKNYRQNKNNEIVDISEVPNILKNKKMVVADIEHNTTSSNISDREKGSVGKFTNFSISDDFIRGSFDFNDDGKAKIIDGKKFTHISPTFRCQIVNGIKKVVDVLSFSFVNVPNINGLAISENSGLENNMFTEEQFKAFMADQNSARKSLEEHNAKMLNAIIDLAKISQGNTTKLENSGVETDKKEKSVSMFDAGRFAILVENSLANGKINEKTKSALYAIAESGNIDGAILILENYGVVENNGVAGVDNAKLDGIEDTSKPTQDDLQRALNYLKAKDATLTIDSPQVIEHAQNYVNERNSK